LNSGTGVPNAEGWTRLPYGPLLVWGKHVNKFNMTEEHPAAAITGDPEIIHYGRRVFPGFDALFVVDPIIGDDFST